LTDVGGFVGTTRNRRSGQRHGGRGFVHDETE